MLLVISGIRYLKYKYENLVQSFTDELPKRSKYTTLTAESARLQIKKFTVTFIAFCCYCSVLT